MREEKDFEYSYAVGLKKSLSSVIGVGIEFDGGFQNRHGFSLTPGLYGTIWNGFDFRVGPLIGLGQCAEDLQLHGTFLLEFLPQSKISTHTASSFGPMK